MPADLPDLVNPVKARMQVGDVSLGMIVRLARSGDVVRIAKSTGHDFVFIDAQHSLFSLETIGHMAQTGLGCGTAVLVLFTGSAKKSDGSEAVARIAWPVPETSTPGAALGVVTIESVAVDVPRTKGAKVTLMVQLEPGANDEPQLFVWLN